MFLHDLNFVYVSPDPRTSVLRKSGSVCRHTSEWIFGLALGDALVEHGWLLRILLLRNVEFCTTSIIKREMCISLQHSNQMWKKKKKRTVRAASFTNREWAGHSCYGLSFYGHSFWEHSYLDSLMDEMQFKQAIYYHDDVWYDVGRCR